MTVLLPNKSDPPTPESIKRLEEGLTSVIVGHPLAVEPWTFYEVLDEFLGPWGNSGYPIGYGKTYCMAFTVNEKLNSNARTRQWVWKTTIRLQELLRDFVVARFKAGTLKSLTESELRQYAFDTHPQAYTEGGLTLVVFLAPEMLPVIATIPGAEFHPASENFRATVKQVVETIGIVAPQAVGTTLAGLAGPAHTGILSRGVRQGMAEMLRQQQLSQYLGGLLNSLRRGELDDLNTLNEITRRLNATEFPNQGFARFAREVVQAANERKRYVRKYYESILKNRPDLRRQLQ